MAEADGDVKRARACARARREGAFDLSLLDHMTAHPLRPSAMATNFEKFVLNGFSEEEEASRRRGAARVSQVYRTPAHPGS